MAECAEAVLSLHFYGVLLIIDQDSKDISLWEVAHGRLEHHFQHTQDTPNGLCKSTSCCQPRLLEISGVQCQEDSSVGRALALQA